MQEQFYVWELRGRGWLQFDYPIGLEPPFVPYRSSRPRAVDDGKRETLLSRLFSKRQPGRAPEPVVEEPLPARWEAPDWAEFHVGLPAELSPSPSEVTEFLCTLRPGSRFAIEYFATATEIEPRMALDLSAAAPFLSQLAAHAPAVVVRASPLRLSERLADVVQYWSAAEFGLASEFMVPLCERDEPLRSCMAALSGLGTDELAVVQFLVEPVRQPWRESMLKAVLLPSGKPLFPASPEVLKGAQEKASWPLFSVGARVLTSSPREGRSLALVREISRSLSMSAGVHHNELMAFDVAEPLEMIDQIIQRSSNRTGMLLSAAEATALVRWPGPEVEVPRLLRLRDRSKAAPAAAAASGLAIGDNEHYGEVVRVRLNSEDRLKHVHLIGASGTGKSTLLLRMILSDIEKGLGVGLLDPHGDLVREILGRIPPDREKDVVLVDPSAAAETVVAWNVLDARSETEQDLLASDLVGVFRRLSTSWGDQMNAVLANAILVFLDPGVRGSVLELRKFLADERYRKAVLRQVHNPPVASFWDLEFPLISSRRPQAPILTRLDSFLRSGPVRRLMTAEDPKLNFQEVADTGKIFLANLSMGAIGEDNAALLGSLMISRFHQVTLMRTAQEERQRRPFFLYVDEFHHVATESMASLFSGARKFRLGVTVAHQDLYQLRSKAPEVERALLANANTRVCFRLGDEDARTLARGFEYFEADDLMKLRVGEAICRVGTRDSDFNVRTSTLPRQGSEVAEITRQRISRISLDRWGSRVATDQSQSSKGSSIVVEVREDPAPVVAPQNPSVGNVVPPSRTIPKELLDYLESVAVEPLLGVRERNAKLSLSAGKGNRIKRDLLQEALVRQVTINPGGRGAHFKLLELTTEGRSVLSAMGVKAAAGHGRGGVAHQWWVGSIAAWLREAGYRTLVEDSSRGARVDLVALIEDQEIAIEVDLRLDHALENLRKDLEAGFTSIVVLVDGPAALDALEAKVGREFSPTPECAVLGDLREFERTLSSLAPPNQNQERRRRSTRRRRKPNSTKSASSVPDGPGALGTPDAAIYLGLSPATLETMRSRGGGPRFSKLGRRVVYRREDLEAWLAERSKRSTSDGE